MTSLKPYPAYRKTDLPWLGQIPAHWESKPLFAVMKERQRKNIGNKESNVLSLSYGHIVRRDVESNFGLLPESFETYQIVEPGNIVLRLTDLQNDKRSLRTGRVQEKGIITSAYTCLQVSNRIDDKFAHYLLYGYDLLKVFYQLGGGVRQTMKFDDLKRLLVLVPPFPEQQTIAAYLDRQTAKIDALIAKKERLLELLAEQRAALISRAVTKGLNPDVKMKDSGVAWLGQVPSHWAVSKLNQVTNGVGDGIHATPQYVDDSEYYFVNGNNLIDGTVQVNETAKFVSEGEYKKYYIGLNSNTILISINGTIGNIACYKSEKIILGKSASYIICRDEYLKDYLYYYLQSSLVLNHFSIEATGTTIKNLSLKSLRNMPLPLPPNDEKIDIAKYLNHQTKRLTDLADKTETAIERLQEYRAALISSVVTGKVQI